jgi:hypothetical protein
LIMKKPSCTKVKIEIDKPIVLIEWHDARFFSGTYKEKAILDLSMAFFKSVGYLISKDELNTTIAAEWNNEGEYRDITLIPSGSIVCIHELMPSSFV